MRRKHGSGRRPEPSVPQKRRAEPATRSCPALGMKRIGENGVRRVLQCSAVSLDDCDVQKNCSMLYQHHFALLSSFLSCSRWFSIAPARQCFGHVPSFLQRGYACLYKVIQNQTKFHRIKRPFPAALSQSKGGGPGAHQRPGRL